MQGSDGGVAVHVGRRMSMMQIWQRVPSCSQRKPGNGFQRRYPPAFVFQVGLQVFRIISSSSTIKTQALMVAPPGSKAGEC